MIQRHLLTAIWLMVDYNFKNMNIEMVDLKSQYLKIKQDIDSAVVKCMESTEFINGGVVSQFSQNLEKYLDVKHVIPCANGTDALQIAMMALNLKRGDEVIVPCFTYVATAEVIALLGLMPIMVDVEPDSFMLDLEKVKLAITPKTKAIVPVHLFGQCCPINELMEIAKEYNLYVIEDTAQAIGAKYKTGENARMQSAGTIGHIGCTSFFPSKNLGCYGDGGALFTNDSDLAKRIKMIANHGQSIKYHHQVVGVNSRLDSIQAVILSIKLKYLNEYTQARQNAANFYDKGLSKIGWLKTPIRISNSTHVFHQYTLVLNDEVNREKFQTYLKENGIPTMVYYPIPLYLQEAYKAQDISDGLFPVTERLCKNVISLPMHSELTLDQLQHIVSRICSYNN